MSMTADERKAVAEEWIRAAQADKIHVQIQVGGTNIRDVLSLVSKIPEHHKLSPFKFTLYLQYFVQAMRSFVS